MKSKWNWLVVLLCCIAFMTSCSVDKKIVRVNEKIIDEKERFSDPEISYSSTVTSLTKQEIIIDLKKIETINKEMIITTQYNLMEHRTLRPAKKEDNTFASEASQDGCCIIMVLPFWLIHVPYKMIESIDKDQDGIYNENSVKPMHALEKSLDINNGYIILEKEKHRIPVANNKIIINLNQNLLKREIYNFELFEDGISKKKFSFVTPLLQAKLANYSSMNFNTIKEIDNVIESLNKLKKNIHGEIVQFYDEQRNELKQNQSGKVISPIDSVIRDLESRRNILLRAVAERCSTGNLVKNLIVWQNYGTSFEQGDVLSIPLNFIKAIDLSQEDGLYTYLVIIYVNGSSQSSLKPFYIKTNRPLPFYPGTNELSSPIKIKYKGTAKYLQNRVHEIYTLLFEEV